jgi:hypothetical protein
VSFYRKMACKFLIQSGERLVHLGKQLQAPMEGAHRPLATRMK